MSKTATPEWMVEWSPVRVQAYDPVARTQQEGGDFATLEIGNVKGVLLALSRRTTFVKAVRVPDVDRLQMIQVLRVTAGNHLPLPANEVAFDVHITADVNLDGRLVSLVAVRSVDLKTALAAAKAAGHKVIRTVPVAWGSVFIAEKLGLRDAVIVQDTEEGWAIDLVHEGGLRYSRLVPGNTTDLEEEVSRTCAASGVPCSDIVAAGGCSLPWANRVYDLNSLQALGERVDALDLNLEPPEDSINRALAEKNIQTRSAAALAIAALGLLGGIYFTQAADAKAAATLNQKWKNSQTKVLKDKQFFDSRRDVILASQKDLDQAFKPGQHLSDALLAASNKVTQGVWLTGASAERGKLLQLRGTALTNDNVTAYVKALAADGRFRDVRLVFANQGQINQTPIVQFSISAVVIGNLPLPSPLTGPVKK